MSVWANEFACNLFNCYNDWYNHWVDELKMEPSNEQKAEAKAYFEKVGEIY